MRPGIIKKQAICIFPGIVFCTGFLLYIHLQAQSQTIEKTVLTYGSAWKMWKGTSHPSGLERPDDWIAVGWNDLQWAPVASPVFYGEPLDGGTQIGDMRNNYTSLFFRSTLDLENPDEIQRLIINTHIDDGVAVWLNGIPMYRNNVPADPILHSATAPATTEPTFRRWVTDPEQFNLKASDNQLAVVVLNTTITSSDIVFDMEIVAEIQDKTPPVIIQTAPADGQSVEALNQFSVTFSEAVTGVAAPDLLINGNEADSVTASLDNRTFTFYFSPVESGRVELTWSGDAAIQDGSGNFFEATSGENAVVLNILDPLIPVVVGIMPLAGSTIPRLDKVDVEFTRPVTGVSAGDLTANGEPSIAVIPLEPAGRKFRYLFDVEIVGGSEITLSTGHSIVNVTDGSTRAVMEPVTVSVDPEIDLSMQSLVINEFSALPATGIPDEDNEAQDWIELFHGGDRELNLRGWGLTDNTDEPYKWIFPAVTIEPGEYLIIFASGKDRNQTGSPLHTNFRLNAEGEYLGLVPPHDPDGSHSEFTPVYPPQSSGMTYGLLETGLPSYLRTKSPGSLNTDQSRIIGVLPPPEISGQGGILDSESQTITIRHPDPEAQIIYTTDGSDPSPESSGQVYTGPFEFMSSPSRPGMVLKSRAFRDGFADSAESVRSFLFIPSLESQSANPEAYPSNWGASPTTTGDYQMAPEIMQDDRYATDARSAWTELPTISISLPPDDLFHPGTGIYANASRSGPQWERRAHFEFISHDESLVTSAFCGIQMQGGSSVNNWKSKKLSFRLVFKSEYGPERLRSPIFPDSPVDNFNSLILDAHLNLTFTHPDHNQRKRSQFVRDAYMSDLLLEAGHASPHSRFCHLFLNGLYWGMYDLHERPDDAFAEQYFGSDDNQYDILKHSASGTVSGTARDWNELISLSQSDPSDSRIASMVDTTNLIDYMLINFYGGNDDWPRHNWYISADVDGGIPFHFHSWDAEHVLKSATTDVTQVNNAGSPAQLFQNLLANPDFMNELNDRIHQHFSSGGIFNPSTVTPPDDLAPWARNQPAEIYWKRFRDIRNAVILESARWGDTHDNPGNPGKSYQRDVEVADELNWLMKTYFPSRSATVLRHLESNGWTSPLPAPVLTRTQGQYPTGTIIRSGFSADTIFYTIDGSDPRGADGSPAGSAASGPVQETLKNYLHIKARAYNSEDKSWSALTSATFMNESIASPIRISEIHYHPADGDPYPEFVELVNIGESPVDLGNTIFEGLDLHLPPGTILPPGEPWLLAGPQASFPDADTNLRILARFDGRLDNGGERLRLADFLNRPWCDVDYDDRAPWPADADGQGLSLQHLDPASPQISTSAQNWISAQPTPGSLSLPLTIQSITMNPDGRSIRLQLDTHRHAEVEVLTSVDLKNWNVHSTQQATGEVTILLPTLASEIFFRVRSAE